MKSKIETIKNIDRFAVAITWTLLFALIFSSTLYGVFVYKMVRNAVAKSEIQSQIVSMGSELSSAEFSYINSVESVTMSSAKLLGFSPVSQDKVVFITRENVSRNVAVR
jgi:hypothetical protein